jgi:spore coat protein CotF
MSHFPDAMFLDHLGNIVADNSNEIVAREAALALGTINTPEARKVLSAVANQTTGIVRETIIEIMGAL